ncbi:MAG: DUF3850 domain-containing protein [Nanoarchaeota archaeon]|nr:DUF3850 domain-containing protein [Nanoarchaeota archaeon]
MEHEKKIWPASFQAILEGKKNYELRLADWECNVGDILILREYDPSIQAYTGRIMRKKIGYIGKTKKQTYFKPEDVEKYGYQILSLTNPD